MKKDFVEINAKTMDKWNKEGWKWSIPIDHQTYQNALKGEWDVVLTPNIVVPKDWFVPFKGLKILGLASAGGQQMPIFAALGAKCTVFDISDEQLNNEKLVQQREGYEINIVKGDMTKTFPFKDEEFDLIFHPVSNSYVKDVFHVFKEASRVLKKGGLMLSGLDTGLNYIVDEEDESKIINKLPFDPLKNEEEFEYCLKNDYGIQFSHTVEEQIKAQLVAGLELLDIYEDTNDEGLFKDLNIGCFIATKSRKK